MKRWAGILWIDFSFSVSAASQTRHDDNSAFGMTQKSAHKDVNFEGFHELMTGGVQK